VVFLERHIERLARSATAFGPDLFVPPDVDAIKALVLEEVAGAKEPMMVRGCPPAALHSFYSSAGG
jgi:branched-subunit amino acid aminotransferase/4-amino-4-deoxychorismate lyase